MKLKTHFGYWLCCWAWLGGMIIAILALGFFDGAKWGYRLMDWLDARGFELWLSYDEVMKALNDEVDKERNRD